jgi:hypothetical protein
MYVSCFPDTLGERLKRLTNLLIHANTHRRQGMAASVSGEGQRSQSRQHWEGSRGHIEHDLMLHRTYSAWKLAEISLAATARSPCRSTSKVEFPTERWHCRSGPANPDQSVEPTEPQSLAKTLHVDANCPTASIVKIARSRFEKFRPARIQGISIQP